MTTNNNEDGLKGLAVASIVCGVTSWIVLAIVLAPMGVVFGCLALKSKDNSTRNCAIVGLIISIVALSLLLFNYAIIAGVRM